MDYYVQFHRISQGVRRLGPAALDLCYVAMGRLDGFWEMQLNVWDIAAGALIVEEAGGIVTDLMGNPNYLLPPFAVVAANPIIHPLMLITLNSV